MAATDDAVQELEAMLDEGVHLDLENAGEGLVLTVRVDEGCEDCLVPDDVMRHILTDALARRGVTPSALEIRHA